MISPETIAEYKRMAEYFSGPMPTAILALLVEREGLLGQLECPVVVKSLDGELETKCQLQLLPAYHEMALNEIQSLKAMIGESRIS